MNQRDDSSSGYSDQHKYLTISALLSAASTIAAVVGGQPAWMAQLVVIAAQLATDLRSHHHTRRTNSNAHPALPRCATPPKLPEEYLPDWIAVLAEYRQGVRYPPREGPIPSSSRECSRA